MNERSERIITTARRARAGRGRDGSIRYVWEVPTEHAHFGSFCRGLPVGHEKSRPHVHVSARSVGISTTAPVGRVHGPMNAVHQ